MFGVVWHMWIVYDHVERQGKEIVELEYQLSSFLFFPSIFIFFLVINSYSKSFKQRVSGVEKSDEKKTM